MIVGLSVTAVVGWNTRIDLIFHYETWRGLRGSDEWLGAPIWNTNSKEVNVQVATADYKQQQSTIMSKILHKLEELSKRFDSYSSQFSKTKTAPNMLDETPKRLCNEIQGHVDSDETPSMFENDNNMFEKRIGSLNQELLDSDESKKNKEKVEIDQDIADKETKEAIKLYKRGVVEIVLQSPCVPVSDFQKSNNHHMKAGKQNSGSTSKPGNDDEVLLKYHNIEKVSQVFISSTTEMG